MAPVLVLLAALEDEEAVAVPHAEEATADEAVTDAVTELVPQLSVDVVEFVSQLPFDEVEVVADQSSVEVVDAVDQLSAELDEDFWWPQSSPPMSDEFADAVTDAEAEAVADEAE